MVFDIKEAELITGLSSGSQYLGNIQVLINNIEFGLDIGAASMVLNSSGLPSQA